MCVKQQNKIHTRTEEREKLFDRDRKFFQDNTVRYNVAKISVTNQSSPTSPFFKYKLNKC